MSGSFTFILAYLTTRQDITESYFHLGMHYKEILLLILTHGFYFSMRQLKRILKSRGLGRRKNRSSLREVGGCIKMELCKWSKDSRVYGLCVGKDTLRNLLKILDPDGVDKFPLWSHLANTITLPWRKIILLSIICSLLIIVWTRKGIWKAVSLKWECPTRAKHYTYSFFNWNN